MTPYVIILSAWCILTFSIAVTVGVALPNQYAVAGAALVFLIGVVVAIGGVVLKRMLEDAEEMAQRRRW